MKKLLFFLGVLIVLCSVSYGLSKDQFTAWYPFENLTDIFNQRNWVVENGSYVPAIGKNNNAINCSDDQRFNSTALEATINDTEGFVCHWIRPSDNLQNPEYIIAGRGNNVEERFYAAYLDTGNDKYCAMFGDGTSVCTTNTYTNEEWFFACTFWETVGATKTAYVYFNDNVNDSVDISNDEWNSFNTDALRLCIFGGDTSAPRTDLDFNGSLDEQVWGGKLTPDMVKELYNSSAGNFPPFFYMYDITVANNSYNSHAINFTSDGGQSCGYNASEEYTLCGPTEDETPTIRFKTVIDNGANCKLWNESKNWTTLNDLGQGTDCTLNGNEYTCTFPENLRDTTHTLYISCKSGDYEMNDFENYPANKFNITIDKAITSGDAIEEGIKTSAIWPGATIHSNQKVYIRALNGTQVVGTFDKFASSGNQRWAFNYISLGESFTNMFNLTPAFYALEMSGLTNSSIVNTVSQFINDTIS